MNFAFVDVEASGPHLLEIAIIRTGLGTPRLLQTLISPGFALPAAPDLRHAAAVHQIPPAALHTAPTFVDALPAIRTFLEGAVVVAHNVAYERRILSTAFAGARGHFAPRQLCTLKLARQVLPTQRSYGLAALLAHHGLRYPHPHTALGDVVALVALMRLLLQRFPVRTQQHIETTLRSQRDFTVWPETPETPWGAAGAPLAPRIRDEAVLRPWGPFFAAP